MKSILQHVVGFVRDHPLLIGRNDEGGVRLEAVLIFASFLALAAASIPTPSHANCSHTAARICGWFSPTPAVSAVTLLFSERSLSTKPS